MLEQKKSKDSVFVTLCQDKGRLIEIANAVCDKNFPPDTDVEIVRSEKIPYLERRKDVAYFIDHTFVVLMEHQNTALANMPLLFLFYMTEVYVKLLSSPPDSLKWLRGLPVPKFYILYTGKETLYECKTISLSEAYMEEGPGSASMGLNGLLNVSVRVLNINKGFNKAILDRSKTLSGYSELLYLSRQHEKAGYELKKAVRLAVEDCIKQGILADFLQERSEDVIDTLVSEMKLEEAKQACREDGIREGMEQAARRLAQKNNWSFERASDYLEIKE